MKKRCILSFSSKEEEERAWYEIAKLLRVRPDSYPSYGMGEFIPRVLFRSILIDSHSQDKSSKVDQTEVC